MHTIRFDAGVMKQSDSPLLVFHRCYDVQRGFEWLPTRRFPSEYKDFHRTTKASPIAGTPRGRCYHVTAAS